jgi:hypothetical protein
MWASDGALTGDPLELRFVAACVLALGLGAGAALPMLLV